MWASKGRIAARVFAFAGMALVLAGSIDAGDFGVTASGVVNVTANEIVGDGGASLTLDLDAGSIRVIALP